MTKRVPKRLYVIFIGYGRSTFARLADARDYARSWRDFPGGEPAIATYELVKPVGRKGRK